MAARTSTRTPEEIRPRRKPGGTGGSRRSVVPPSPAGLVRFAGASTSGLRERRWARAAALVVIAGLLGSGLWMLRWSGGGSTATPDTFWYARDALLYAGHSPPRRTAPPRRSHAEP
ncbi:hypothetical protein [Actinomadura madurae]|uniref:hypothetical protein n=1 Tax=Actinomadura madurae TaxID=1993 RepID=UPI0020D25AA6|nr:hypothetical protein [Actinomadura madurae]MCQ0017415.1 hypothetical protein [Actinomadura madurae]